MIEHERRGEVALIRLAHGTASAMDLELCEALTAAVAEAETGAARAVVLTGTGRIFSAGVDLKRLLDEGQAYLDRFLPALDACFDAWWRCDKPVVVACNGHAIAGGCVLVACGDYRLMAEGSGRIGVPELRVGVPFPPQVLEILRSALPAERLREVVLLGETYPADEAFARGLVDEIEEPAKLLDRACAVAAQLGAVPPAAFALNKRQIRQPALDWLAGPGAGLAAECRAVWASPDCRAAVERYVAATLKK